MTCIVGLTVPKYGAVIACDSRLTVGSEILSDTCQKWLTCGRVMLAIAGSDGGLPTALERCRSWKNVTRVADKYTHGRDLDWAILGFELGSPHLAWLHQNGAAVPLDVATVGSGAQFARGWMDAKRPPRDLNAAAKLAAGAVAYACSRDACCGGVVRVLVATRDRVHVI